MKNKKGFSFTSPSIWHLLTPKHGVERLLSKRENEREEK
jgi:hypothetical protein